MPTLFEIHMDAKRNIKKMIDTKFYLDKYQGKNLNSVLFLYLSNENEFFLRNQKKIEILKT